MTDDSKKVRISHNVQIQILMSSIHCCTFAYHVEGRRGRVRMVVGFTTTYAISAYHH